MGLPQQVFQERFYNQTYFASNACFPDLLETQTFFRQTCPPKFFKLAPLLSVVSEKAIAMARQVRCEVQGVGMNMRWF